MYLIFRRHGSTLLRAFGNPFSGGDNCARFFPPWEFQCSQSESTTSTEKATSTTDAPSRTATQTTVVVSSRVITSVTVVTSGGTTTAETTIITGTTVTSAITPTPPSSEPSSTPSDASTEPSATNESPSVSNSSEPTALPDKTTTGSETSPLPTLPPSSPSIQTTTVSATLSPTGAISGQQQVHNLSGGEIAAICIACLSVLVLSAIILRASKRRAANAALRSIPSTRGTDAASITPQADTSRHSAHDPGRSLSPGNMSLPSPGPVEENLNANEKGNLEFGYLARGPSTSSSHSSAMSPSSALSPSPLSPSLLSPVVPSPTSATALLPMSFNDAIAGPVALSPYALSPTMTIPTSSPEPSNAAAFSPTMPSPVIASPVTVTARRFRGAWDDPPPTPEYRPLSLRMSQLATFVHPEALDIAQPAPPAEEGAVQRNPRFRDSVLGDGRSEAEGDQLPEYSRY